MTESSDAPASDSGEDVELHNGMVSMSEVHPKCRRCGAEMRLEYVEPLNTGDEDRAYKCSSCDGDDVGILKF
ncbi:MAG: hypothetical protein ABW198_04275 [Pseudorhodoplanes sp.]